MSNTKTEVGLIFKQIPLIMSEVGAVGKDSKNLQQNYNYRGIDAVYNALNEVMSKHKVFSTCIDIQNEQKEERTSKQGTALFTYSAIFTYRFYAEDGSFTDTKVIGKGMDSGDKDTNKAMSVAHKYALLQIFCIPTDEEKDPEVDSHEVKSKENGKKKEDFLKKSAFINLKKKIENGEFDFENKDTAVKFFEGTEFSSQAEKLIKEYENKY